MPTMVHEMRGIPFWLLREYLEEMGGKAVGEDVLVGDGWQVKMTRMEPFRLGSLEVGQVKLEVEVEADKEADFRERFAKKTFRAGG